MSYLEKTKQYDPVRPGEQWFFYWKTSASLWESRIVQFPEHEVIFIPLYWGFHAESSQEWDFGRLHPERDLLRLTRLLTQRSRRFCWILPLTPAPFYPNGGVPSYSARTLSVTRDGVHLAVFDHELQLNKMFSYFEPKVFQAWGSFLEAFGKFLIENQIKAPAWGAQFYYFQDNEKFSYLEDCSFAFEQGFSRFLKQNHPEGVDLTETKKESELKETFTYQVEQLFKATAESILTPFWKGVQRVIPLGGSPKETILRAIPGGKSQHEYTKDLFHHFIHSDLVSSALLSPEEKKEVIKWVLHEHFGHDEISLRYQYSSLSGELTSEFRPFGVVDIFEGKKNYHFKKIGLEDFLNKHFRWLYKHHQELDFSPEWIDVNHHRIKFFHASELNRTTFAQALKLFMMGQRILIDTSGIPEGLDKKLQIFLMENNLKGQSVNFITTTQILELGDGRLVLFDGQKLIDHTSREKFWDHIFRYFSLSQPEIQMDGDVFTMWRIRATTPHELSYLDVRRVNIYNPTSYKKNIFIKTHKNFAFMRMIDPTRAQAKSSPEGVDVELLPSGKIALDFGHFEES